MEHKNLLWLELERKLYPHNIEIKTYFNEAAEFIEIQALEELVGQTLPTSFKVYLLGHNGQKKQINFPFWQFKLIPIQEIKKEWLIWKDLLDAGDFEGEDAQSDCEIENVWWSKYWIPITRDSEGNSICLDLKPTSQGYIGQVIQVWHDEPYRKILASDFETWFRKNILVI